MVSDITRMGEWSPVCRSCRWDEGVAAEDGAGPRVGAWFTGHNVDEGREWDTHCEVVAAAPGREFAFAVAGTFVRWTYKFAPASEAGVDGTRLTETWEPQPDLLAFYKALGFGIDDWRRCDLAIGSMASTTARSSRTAPTTNC